MHKKTKQKPEACTHTYPHTVCKKTPPVYIHPLTPNLLHYMLASTFYLHPSAYSISNHSAVQNVILYKQSWWQWSASKVFYISVSSFQCAVYNNKIYKTAKTARNNHQIWPRPRLCKVACASVQHWFTGCFNFWSINTEYWKPCSIKSDLIHHYCPSSETLIIRMPSLSLPIARSTQPRRIITPRQSCALIALNM